jgi:hypothetical protein
LTIKTKFDYRNCQKEPPVLHFQEPDAESEFVVSQIQVAARPVGQAMAAAIIRPSIAAATAQPVLRAKTFPAAGQVSISTFFFILTETKKIDHLFRWFSTFGR